MCLSIALSLFPEQRASFSRVVRVSASPVSQHPANDRTEPPATVASFGSLLRVHRVQDGHRIDEERLTLPAQSTTFESPTKWTVVIENGDDAPIQLGTVRLEMLERNLCFEASGGAAYTLYYGDAVLVAPRYDYASLFTAQVNPARAKVGPEKENADFQARPDDRPFTERHPILLWIALGLVILLLGTVALRSAKVFQHRRRQRQRKEAVSNYANSVQLDPGPQCRAPCRP